MYHCLPNVNEQAQQHGPCSTLVAQMSTSWKGINQNMEFEQFSHLLVRRNLLKALGLPTVRVMFDEGLRLDFDSCRGLVDSVLGDAHVVRRQIDHGCVVSPYALTGVKAAGEERQTADP
jgi:hypothetical protein